MPELPEVETIVRSLHEGTRYGGLNVIGQQVRETTVLWERTLENISPDLFQNKIAGQTVKDVYRRGKFLVFTLSSDTLLMHLRMSGDLRVEAGFWPDGSKVPLQPHDRLVLWFAGGLRMAFNNPRKFGRIWMMNDPQAVLGVLGPEPLDPALTEGKFHAMLQSHKRMLKPLLMDQHFLAGLGNRP